MPPACDYANLGRAIRKMASEHVALFEQENGKAKTKPNKVIKPIKAKRKDT